MIRFYDVANTAHIAQATLKRSTGVNGSKTVTGEIIAGNAVINGIGRGWSLVFDDEPYVITYTKVNDQTKSVEFDAIQKFFWDFAKSGFYQEWNGSHTFTAYLNALFENTGYEYILDVDVAAFEKENWGMKNRLTLFNDVISQAGVEFELIGKRVKITKAIGSDLSTIVRKGFNLSDMVSESSITDFVTYGKGFGAFNDSNDHSKGRMEVEYKSPLADTYGVLEADPVVDERYTIAGSLLAAVKARVDDSVAISIDLKIYDLPEADFTYQVPQAGDWIMAIDEAIGFSRRIRIIKVDEEFDVNGQRIDYTATCGDLPIAVQQELAQSGQVHKLEQLTKDVDAAAINANGKNTNYYGAAEPSQPREGDLWYKENGDNTELYVWADGRWEIVVSKNTNDIIDQKVDAATAEISGIRDQTNAAVSTANQAAAAAGFANDAAYQAKTAAASAQADAANALSGTSLAQQDATKALASAQAALTSVAAANDTANRADSSASTAQASAQAAIKSAQTALSMASGADAKATTADSNATDALSGANIALDSATTALNQAKSAGSAATSTAIIAKSNQSAISTLATKTSVNTLTSQVASTATLQKQTADELLSKADSSVVDSLTSTANSTSTLATQTATALKSKAEISTVNTVNSTATSAATLATQTATTLKSKADSTTVDKLTGRVSSAESKLTQTATKAELALTQNDIDDLGDTVSSQGVKLAVTATAAELAATQDNVDTLKKTVTNNTAGVTANAKQIALKANQTDVDTLKGTVTSQGAQVAVTASQVALKADTATVNNLGKTVESQGAQLSLTATEVDLEAAQSAVDAVTQTATSNAAGIATNANAIKLKADSSTVSTLDGRVTSLSGQLDVQSDLISAKVTASDVTGMLNGYATQSWSQGQISAAKNEISASVETVKQTVDNWQVGGTNLAPGTSSDWQKVSVQSGWGTTYLCDPTYEIVDGETYTMQVEVRNITSPIMLELLNYTAAGARNGNLTSHAFASDDTKIIVTFTAKLPEGYAYFRPDLAFTSRLTGAGSYEYRRFKLETGTMATDWSPAPEDQATVDWTKSQLDIKDGKISAAVTSLKSDITNATADMATTTWTNSQITAAKQAISLDVEQSITTSENTLNSNIDNATNDMATKTWTKGQLSVTDGSISASVQKLHDTVTGEISTATNDMATQTWTQGKLDLTADGLTSQISSVQDGLDTKYTRLEQTLSGVQATANNAVTQGQLTLLSDKFTSKIGPIDLTAGTVSSQITQLQSDINLRVKTGDLVSQINVAAGNVLIQSGKLYLDAASVVMGGTAFINAANIKSVNASTITTGTLDAATVNVVGINASNITTGVINGANLSINLTTGEILFQRGAIKSTNGNLDIDIDSGNMAVTNSAGNGFRFEDGKLFLTSNTWVDSYQSKPDYGYISYEPNFLSNVQGMQIAGTDGIAVTAGDYDTFSFLFQHQPNSGAALALHDNTAFLNAREHTRIEGGSPYTETFLFTNGSRASIVVGGANGGPNRNGATDQYGNYHPQEPVNVGADLFMKGTSITFQGGGQNGLSDLNLGSSGGKGHVSSAAIYNRTYSSGDHVVITGYGILGRLTSARKYKIADQVATGIVAKAQRVLSINPAEWYDKAEIESIADAKTNGTEAPGEAKIEKHYGFIADDFDAAGLTEVVNYHNGEVDSLSYDHISMYHHVILQNHEKRIAELEAEVKQLKGEI